MINHKIQSYNILSEWCGKNGLFVRSNSESFFINERVLMKPEFIINETVYIDLIEKEKITDKYIGYCESFSKSFGTLILIPKDLLKEIKTVSKKDFEERYNIRF